MGDTNAAALAAGAALAVDGARRPLVSAAGLMALGRLLVPWLVDSPQTVAIWLGERIGRKVELESVDAHWSGPGPVLDLGGLRLSGAPGEPAAITLGRARVQVDVYALLLPGRHLIHDFLLVDARLALVRERDGRILLEGFGHTAPPPGIKAWLGRVGHLGLSGGQLELVDRASERSFVTNGRERILDIVPTSLHERVSVVLGWRNEVQRVTDYHAGAA